MVTNTCASCGKVWKSTTHAERCRPCWEAARRKERPVCQSCGGPVSTRRSVLCRACDQKRRSEQVTRPTCLDCGVTLTEPRSVRCAPCHLAMVRKTVRQCQDCGTPLPGRRQTRCRACWFATTQRTEGKGKTCATCGGPMSTNPQSEICRTCWLAKKIPDRKCLDCSKTLRGTMHDRCKPCRAARSELARRCTRCADPTTWAKSILCRTCVQSDAATRLAQRVCQDCGEPVSTTTSARCMSCRIALDHALATQHVCLICGKKARAKNLCPTHHRANQRLKQGVTTTSNAKLVIAKMPCTVCNYDRMNSDVHRFIPGAQGGKYTLGNMVPVCKRCHGEIHAGVTICPPALDTL